jgi:Carboxypeptidase regulatory-like domain
MQYPRPICIVFVIALVGATSALSQAVNGSLVGMVTDSSGAAVPTARITVIETNTGVRRSINTNESGNYTFSDLPPGTYTVTAEQTGFKRASRAGIALVVNSTERVDLMLEPGQITETIEVTAAAAILQTERADTGRSVETKAVQDLPIGTSHNFQSLSILVPGSARVESQHSAFFNPQTSYATRFNGQSRLGNNLQLEGIDDNEHTGLLQVLIPPQEAIQSVDISTSDYDAELGRATGGAINVILKSGTNQYHGEAYEFNRVSALSARNFFDSARGHFTYNYFGGTIGGPIIHNRTFFFGDYLRIEDHSANNDRLTLPTAAERLGDLSVAPTAIYDPGSGDPATGVGRAVFDGNQIPMSKINKITAKILSLIPLPNLPGLTNNYFVTSPFYRNTDQFDVKVDHNQTDSDRFSIRYSFSRPVTFDAAVYGIYGGPRGTGGAGFEGTGVQGTHSGAINYDHLFSPTLLTEARFGVNRYRNDAQQVGYGQNVSDQLGVPGVNVSPFTSGPFGVQLDNFGNTPFFGFSPSLPWIRAETNVLFTNIWTKTKGNHTIKFGFDMRRIRDDLLQTQTFSPRGLFHFKVDQTSNGVAPTSFGNAMASFLLGVPGEVGRDLPIIFPAYRAWEFFSFVQDKWVVTSKLTVEIGLRWEFYPPATPARKAGFSQYNPTNNTLMIAGVGGNPSDLGLDKHYKDFAPRLGIAYRLGEKTVIRTGFGISFAPFPDNTYAYNFPVKQNNAFEPNCSICPAVLPNGQVATFQAGFPPATPAVIPSNGIIATPDPSQVYFQVNPHFREPYVESWNLAVQRTLPYDFVLDVAYVGNHGVDQPANYNLNASTTIGADVQGQPEYLTFARKANTELRYVGYSSMYNGLQLKLDKRFSGGFGMTTAYTFSKALGYQSEDSFLEFFINPRRNWQRLNFDRKHFFVQSYVYELPFGRGKQFLQAGPASWILGGWQINGILTIASGAPLGNNGGTVAFSYSAAGLKAPGNQNTLNHFGPIHVLYGDGFGNPWFDNTKCSATVTTNCFAPPGPLQFGNLGPNLIDGPGYWNLDASLFRNFKINERWNLQLRGEAFSVVNTPQWGQPNTDYTSANFGLITGLANQLPGGQGGGARQIQLGAKLTF